MPPAVENVVIPMLFCPHIDLYLTFLFGYSQFLNCLVIYSRRPVHSLRTIALHLSWQNHKYRNWVCKTNIVELKAPRTSPFSWVCMWMVRSFVAKTATDDKSDRESEVLGTELGIHILNLGLVVVLKG